MIDFKQFLNESQDPQAVEKIVQRISGLLTKGEEIQYIAVQKMPLFNYSPGSVALTNKRIIFCRPTTFGLSMDFEDILWKEVLDAHIREEMLGAVFTVKKTDQDLLTMEYLPKAQARLLYRYSQEKEEEMAEFRRQRELEDSRARAGGGVFVNTNGEKKEKTVAQNDPVATLKKLKELLEADLISQEEFDTKKLEILSKL